MSPHSTVPPAAPGGGAEDGRGGALLTADRPTWPCALAARLPALPAAPRQQVNNHAIVKWCSLDNVTALHTLWDAKWESLHRQYP